jgi:exonuclease III
MDNDKIVPVKVYTCSTQYKRQDIRAGGVAIYEKNNATTMATPHLLMKLDKQNTANTSFKLAASDSCGDVCAAECRANGQKVLVVTVYVSPNTPSYNWKSLIFSNLDWYSPKVCKLFKFLARRSCEDMPIILAGDFNVNVKDNYNAELVEFMKDTFELDVLLDPSLARYD